MTFFGGTFFGGGFFGGIGTGTGGVDPGDGGRRPFKPTGLLDRPKKKEGRKEVAERVEDSRQIQAEIAGKLAREFGEETIRLKKPEIVQMTAAEIDFEIGVLLRKKIRSEEDDFILLLLMAAA